MTGTRIAVILAGGGSARMGRDKAIVQLQHVRLIDHVIARLAGQVDHIVVSGPSAFGTGLQAISDHPDTSGPMAGITAVKSWLASTLPDAQGFMSVPVDGPFCPRDLHARLKSPETSAYAVTKGHQPHPTFAWWRHADLDRALSAAPRSLLALARAADATPVSISPDHACFNVNTPDDLHTAGILINTHGGHRSE